MALTGDLPLNRKLTLVIVGVCAAVVTLSCIVLAAYEAFDFRRTLASDATALADIVASNVQAAMAFRDEAAATRLLQGLAADPSVQSARVFDAAGEPFADFRRDGVDPRFFAHALAIGSVNHGGRFVVARPVTLEGKQIGTLHLQVSLHPVAVRLGLFSGVALVVLVGAVSLALVLSERLQRPITGPILALADLARTVAELKDYSVRASPGAALEVRNLTNAFNLMLGEIGRQDGALRESEARTRAIVDTALDAIITIDEDSRITDWNARAEAILGWRRDEVLGRSIVDTIIPERFREPHLAGVRGYLANGAGAILDRRIEMSACRRDGREFPVELSVSATRVAGHATFSAFLRDITAVKAAEEQREHLIDELRKTNSYLEQYAYVSSHDLQEPLRMITQYLGVFTRRYAAAVDDAGKQYLAHATEGATRMRQLIQDLLAYSRASHAERAADIVDLREIVADVLRLLQPTVAEQDARISVGPLPRVRGIRVALFQVFQNLIGNALKFHGAAPVEIAITAERTGDTWTVSVADNGIGIDPAYRDRIFDVFQKLHSRGEYAGTGIGLAICKKVVEHHGGRIWVDSEPGRGADFRFTLSAEA